MTIHAPSDAELLAPWQQALKLQNLEREKRPPIENLVCEGGGVKGLVYAGALEVLDENGILQGVKRVAGSSAGGIVSVLLALGYPPIEIKKLMEDEIDFKSLMDKRVESDPTRFISAKGMKLGVSDLWMLFKHKGVYQGEAFVELSRNLIRNKLEQKLKAEIINQVGDNLLIGSELQTRYEKLLDKYYIKDPANITFSQLNQLNQDFPNLGLKELYLTGTKLSDASLKVFSAENDPNMAIVDALRITMSFPFGFEPVLYQGDYYADGGIADNYPMQIFDHPRFLSHGRNDAKVNPCTLGLLVDSQEEIDARWGVSRESVPATLSRKELVGKVLKGVHGRSHLLKDIYTVNSIQIFDEQVKTMDLNLSKENKAKLISSGQKAMQQYIDDYLGEDIQYQSLPDYQDVYEKYYSKGPVELQRIIEKEIWPFYQTIKGYIDAIEKIDLDNELEKVNTELSLYHSKDRQSQQELYESISDIQDDLADLRYQKELVSQKIQDIEKEKRHLARTAGNEGLSPDEAKRFIEKIDVQRKQLAILQSKISASEASLVELEKNRVRPIYDLIVQKGQLERLKESNIIETLEKSAIIMDEHLDIALEALSHYQKEYPDPRELDNDLASRKDLAEDEEYSQEIEPANTDAGDIKRPALRDYEYSLKLRQLIARLGTGKWGDQISFENRRDLEYNLDPSESVVKLGYGKKMTEFSVTTLEKKSTQSIKYLSFKREYAAPSLKAHFLVPSQQYIQNKNNSLKEIIVAFEPHKSKKDQFTDISRFSKSREALFQEHKNEFIQQIEWAIRQSREKGIKPPDAKFKITIMGEGLAGQDAQYFLAELVKEMNLNKDLYPNLAFIGNIELDLIDPSRVSKPIAVETAENIKNLKKSKPELEIKGYTLIHKYYLRNKNIRRKAQNYFGSSNVLSKVEPSDAVLVAEFRRANKKDAPARVLSNQNESEKELIIQELNKSNLRYRGWFFKTIHLREHQTRKIAKVIFIKYIPGLVKFIAKSPIKISRFTYNRIKEPSVKIVRNIKKRLLTRFQRKRNEPIASWSAQLISGQPQPESSSVEHAWSEAALEFTANAGKTARLKAEKRPPIENMVFEGGGLDVLVLGGALQEMEKNGMLKETKRVAGSSGGGVTAGLLAVGFSADEIIDIFKTKINSSKILDAPISLAGIDKIFSIRGVDIGITEIVSLFRNKGIYKGAAFKNLLQELVSQKLKQNIKQMLFNQLTSEERLFLEKSVPGLSAKERDKLIDDHLENKFKALLQEEGIADLGKITFIQLKKLSEKYPELHLKELFVTGTKISDASLKVFSADSNPEMPIIDAIRITMSYPGGFMPVEFEGEYYVDGSIADNYPMHIFDAPNYLTHGVNEQGVNPCTLGLVVDSQEKINSRWGIISEQKEDIHLKQFVGAVLKGMHHRAEILRDKYNINSIQMSANVALDGTYQLTPIIDFKSPAEFTDRLVQNGHEAVAYYHDNYLSEENGIIRYHLFDHYDDLDRKYDKREPAELKRILEDEIQPLLDSYEKIKDTLKENKAILKSELAICDKELQPYLDKIPQAQALLKLEQDIFLLERQIANMQRVSHTIEKIDSLKANLISLQTQHREIADTLSPQKIEQQKIIRNVRRKQAIQKDLALIFEANSSKGFIEKERDIIERKLGIKHDRKGSVALSSTDTSYRALFFQQSAGQADYPLESSKEKKEKEKEKEKLISPQSHEIPTTPKRSGH